MNIYLSIGERERERARNLTMGVESANKTNRPLEVMSQIWRSPSPEIRDSVSTISTTRPNPPAGHRRRVQNAVQIAVARAIRLVIEKERETERERKSRHAERPVT